MLLRTVEATYSSLCRVARRSMGSEKLDFSSCPTGISLTFLGTGGPGAAHQDLDGVISDVDKASYPVDELFSPAVTHTSVLLSYLGGSLLFGCGEGTCAQLRLAYEKLTLPSTINHIVIPSRSQQGSWGLPAVLRELRQRNPSASPPRVYGPIGLQEDLAFNFHNRAQQLHDFAEVVELSEVNYINSPARSWGIIAEIDGVHQSPFTLGVSWVDNCATASFGMVFSEPAGSRFDTSKARGLNIPLEYWQQLLEGKKVDVPTVGMIIPDRLYSTRNPRKVVFVPPTASPYNLSQLAFNGPVVVADATYRVHGDTLQLNPVFDDFLGQVRAQSFFLTGVITPAASSSYLEPLEKQLADLRADLPSPAAVAQLDRLFFALSSASRSLSVLQLSEDPARLNVLARLRALIAQVSELRASIDFRPDFYSTTPDSEHFAPSIFADGTPIPAPTSPYVRSEATELTQVHIEE